MRLSCLTNEQLDEMRRRCRKRNDPWTERADRDWSFRSRLSRIEDRISVLQNRRIGAHVFKPSDYELYWSNKV